MSMFSISSLRAGVLVAAALVGPMSFRAQAQDQGARVQVNVPFDFESGSRQFKAGTYIIGSLNQQVALVRGSTSGMALMQESQDREVAASGRVDFHKYGSRYFISDIFVLGHMNHLHVLESKDEKQARRAAQESRQPNQTVAVLEFPR